MSKRVEWIPKCISRIIFSSVRSEKEQFVIAFKEANYLWILLALLVAFLSHFSRAYRWKYLLQTLDIKPNLNLMNPAFLFYICIFY